MAVNRRFSLTRIEPTEDQHQAFVIAWADLVGVREFPELRWLHHIPNGGARDHVTGARLKAQGVRRGIFDLSLPVARGGFHGLYVEMKRRGERLRPEQREFEAFVAMQGYCTRIAYSGREAVEMIVRYLRADEKKERSEERP